MKSEIRITILAALVVVFGFISFRQQIEAPTSTIRFRAPATVQSRPIVKVTTIPVSLRPEPLRSLNDLFKQHPGAWNVHQDRNRIYSISGGLIRADVFSDEQALQFSRGLAGVFGVHPEQITSQGQEPVETSRSRVFSFVQKIDNYAVYQGYISVATRTMDGSVFMINNNLRSIQEFESGIILPDHQLTEIVQDQNESYGSLYLSNPEPVWFNSSADHAVLARVLRARAGNQEVEIVVNAQTGQLLYQTAGSIE